MLKKWKCILINWINCYFKESGTEVQSLNVENLLKIISHLRQCFNLDESKSSILGANTLEEFLLEKYPNFKFENGTVEARSEEELCLAASLLLFFVCVNSKDVDIKNAMCSRLSAEDQEIILKFSKILMECPPVFCRDVQAAIAEACSQDVVTASTSSGVTVAETPPVIRTLHSEVRRLQAALDAERFDRNYLQEELSRTNSRIQQLLKEKEQHKLDIVHLKTQISLCCGQENKTNNSELEPNHTAKLTRELEEIEKQLVQTKGELDEIVYERDVYKSKVEELKKDRDKWLALSQAEVEQAIKIKEELEVERLNVVSLKELVNELQQHNKLNRVDSSFFECDDLDASAQSLHHNSSVCSEACANVIEVQLIEEKAKVTLLQEQIQRLQDQITELNEKYDSEKHNFGTLINAKETENFNLKHSINELIEEKSKLKAYFDEEVTKLNNDINELEQRLKGNSENSRMIIERKMHEIYMLQEEKLMLLKSFENESVKNENIITSLKEEIDFEKRTKLEMKENYETQIMKFNEKVLNRNNELVELQNNIFEKSEMIESLHLDLRREKEMIEEISNKYHSDIQQLNYQKTATEQYLQQKADEVTELKTITEQKVLLINELQQEINHLKTTLSSANEECKYLQDTKGKLLMELQSRELKLEEIYKDIENLKNVLREEKEKLNHDVDEKNATINALKNQLQDEINYKISLQKQNTELEEKIQKIQIEVSNLKNIIQNKDETMKTLQICLQKEKELNVKLTDDYNRLNEKLNKITDDIDKKEIEIKSLSYEYENSNRDFLKQLSNKDKVIEMRNKTIDNHIVENESLRNKLSLINNEKLVLERHLAEKTEKIVDLERDIEIRSKGAKEAKSVIEQKLDEIGRKYKELENNFDTQTSRLLCKLNETEKVIIELSSNSKKTIREKEYQIQKLVLNLDDAEKTIQNKQAVISQIEREKEVLVQKLEEEVCYKINFEKEYQNQYLHFDHITSELNEEVNNYKKEVHSFETKLASALQAVEEKSKEIQLLEDTFTREVQRTKDLVFEKDKEIKENMSKLSEIQSLNSELNQKFQEESKLNIQTMSILKKENEHLQFIIEEENNNRKVALKEKDIIIDALKQKLKAATAQLESMKKEFEDVTLNAENYKVDLLEKAEKMDHLIKEIAQLKQKRIQSEEYYNKINTQLNEVIMEKNEIESHLKSKALRLQETLSLTEEKHVSSVKEINDLLLQSHEDKAIINSLIKQKDELSKEIDIISNENKKLLNENEILTQGILEEKSVSKISEEQKNILLQKKLSLENELLAIITIKNSLAEKNDYLTKQLTEEKLAIELIEKLKHNLYEEREFLNNQLIAEKENSQKIMDELNKLTDQITIMKEKNIKLEEDVQILQNKLQSLNQELCNEKFEKKLIIKEKQSLNSEKDLLEQEIIECKSVNNELLKEKDVLLVERETLEKSLGKEKSALDEAENEKNILKIKIEDLNKQHELEIIKILQEVTNISQEIKHLKLEYEDLKQDNAKISEKLNTALSRLMETLKMQNISNEVLQKLMVEKTSEMSCSDKCDLLINIADSLATELTIRKNRVKALEHENTAFNELKEIHKQKDIQIFNLQAEAKQLEQIVQALKLESLKQANEFSDAINSKDKQIQILQKENETLNNSLTDVKFQLEIKVHSLKEKLTDNEDLTDKLKKSYECQIDNLNLMMTKLTNYLKDKTIELEAMRKENTELQQIIENNQKVIKSLEDEVKISKHDQEKMISDFESERLVLKNMITVTESVMEDQKNSLNNIISQHMKANAILHQENETLKDMVEKEKDNSILKIQEKDVTCDTIRLELADVKQERDKVLNDVEMRNVALNNELKVLKDELSIKVSEIETMELQNKENSELIQKYKDDISILEKQYNEFKINKDNLESEKQNKVDELTKLLIEQTKVNKDLETILQNKSQNFLDAQEQVQMLEKEVKKLIKENNKSDLECTKHLTELEEANTKNNLELSNLNREIEKLTNENAILAKRVEENGRELDDLKQQTKDEVNHITKLFEDCRNDKMALMDKCLILQDYQVKAEKLLEERQNEINLLKQEIQTLQSKIVSCNEDLKAKDDLVLKINKEKDDIITAVTKELSDEKAARKKITASYMAAISTRQNIELGQQETCLLQSQIKAETTDEDRRLLHQVDNLSSDIAYSSTDSLKTIADLEKIINDKNRKITTLQTDITHLKSMLAESEIQLIDVRREFEMSKENCQQLSAQLKKIVYQKNEEIAELKRQVNKMSVTENRATQIIKVSAKYQAIILKRIAEIKSNTVLTELTNLGNGNSCENELRRSLPDSVTMEDLENFLETTDRHLKRCADRQAALQKERDRLMEINRINESEIINLRKYLTEISITYQTFTSVKDLYVQKLSRVLSIQRTVRREILSLDGHITADCMCKLERGYAAIMQDLSECAMNLERWVENCIARTVTPEKIKQALNDSENVPRATSSFQNAGLEVQIEELEKSFQKLLEEAARASKGEAVTDAQAITVSEVRAEYEDKLNRMKAKMNQLYHEQIGIFKEKQKEDIALLKRELHKTREKLATTSEAYEEHIKKLTNELWRVGEKFIVEKNEADGLRRKNRSGSLMSLQHVHSSGLATTLQKVERPSDAHSLRSLQLNNNGKREGRDLHMSDEGEVFDNQWLKELSSPRKDRRLSELRWRNSLCPPHLKSSYPAETQFAPALDEEDIKCASALSSNRQQRKEVGITAYKKPGPPTPSKQAGRLSATDSELRESLRVDCDPQPSRKTGTPSRLRSLFRSSKNETNEGTPRSRRLSHIFRKK